MTNQRALEELGETFEGQIPHWTLHDLRSTFATLASEKLGAPMHVTDRMLNHVGSSTRAKIARIYNRSELFEPRQEISNQWSDFLVKYIVSANVKIEGRKSKVEAHCDQEEFIF